MAVAQRFEDLIVWQLGAALRDLVYAMTAAGAVLDDGAFKNQIRDSASSVPRNVAEGFARFDPPEFAQFVKIAKGSLAETQNHLRHGRQARYFSEEQYTEAWRLSCRLARALYRFHTYLRNCPGKSRKIPKNPRTK